MGGVMIKVGQFLSSRVDVLPEEITKELADLQDEVAPENFEDIRQIAETEFGASLSKCFLEFDPEPLAAASLGQVHRAKLHKPVNGFDQVVVKVQRPNIETIIQTDLAALETVGRWIRRLRPISKRANVPALLKEFSDITFEEIDYLAEGENAETFAANFKDRPGIKVPKVVWAHTTKRVLTLENVLAIKITDYESITAAGISRAGVAQRLFETYLQQIFEDGFFHADPHPGNLFVAPVPHEIDNGKQNWTLTFVDFGMVGKVPPNLRAGLREMAIGIGIQNPDRVITSFQMLGVLLPEADTERIKELIVTEFERFGGKSMTELQQIQFDEMRELAIEYRDLIVAMPFQMPAKLLFLFRCVGILSGMCMGLNPDFNAWKGIEPYAKKIIAEETTKNWHYWLQELGTYGLTIIRLPRRLDTVLNKMERGDMSVNTPSLNQYAARIERSTRRITNAVVFALLFFSGVQLYLAEELTFGMILLIGSIIPLWRIIFPSRRT
ncbi:MAG: AarF/ABC1/UbiB kinase family protein [Desulfobacterales bacterium]|jgi:predicted unusual protein kinase regulating ubiquinone biosynthesis (AarF/ABC1/UbiB family)|nr:AarF/ABC1/UbiB kinase family protein [Desulfobacterales bacterium]